MIKCWSCGTEHESPASNDAHNRELQAEYSKGYLEGYTDAEKHYTNKCTLCGTGGIVSWLCNTCKEENPRWMGE